MALLLDDGMLLLIGPSVAFYGKNPYLSFWGFVESLTIVSASPFLPSTLFSIVSETVCKVLSSVSYVYYGSNITRPSLGSI